MHRLNGIASQSKDLAGIIALPWDCYIHVKKVRALTGRVKVLGRRRVDML